MESVTEKAISELHDVRLVDTRDLLPVVRKSKAQRKLRNALGLFASDDLQRLNHALDGLVFKARVLALRVLTNNAKINIFVSRFVTRNVLDQDN